MNISDLVTFSDDLREAFLTFGRLDAPITQSDVLHILESNGLGEAFIFNEAISALVEKINKIDDSSASKKRDSAFLIAEIRDAVLDIEISGDGLSASLCVTQGYGGEKISYERILDCLKENRIRQGIDMNAIKMLLQQCAEIPPSTSFSQLVAQGTAPIDGEDARFESYQGKDAYEFIPEVDKLTGKVDILSSYHLLTVSPGEPLMRLHPATQGRDGVDVYGVRLAAHDGIELEFTIYEGSQLNATDSLLLEAARSGQPQIYDDGVAVLNVLEVDNVDQHTGNIDFDGSIIVNGDIRPKMEVKVSGDLEVKGVIEDANISVKGALFAVKGIIGKQNLEMEDLSCEIYVDGKIRTDFIQYAHVESTSDIDIISHITHSEVITDGKLTVLNSEQSAGSIIGGVISANMGIEACYLGSDAEVETHCEVFFHYIELCKELAQQKKLKEEYYMALEKLEMVKEKFELLIIKGEQKDLKDKLSIIMQNQLMYKELLSEGDEELDKLKETIKMGERSVMIKVHENIYPACKLTIGTHRLATIFKVTGMQYSLFKGELRQRIIRKQEEYV